MSSWEGEGLREGGSADEGSALLECPDAGVKVGHFDAAGAGVSLREGLGGAPALVHPFEGAENGVPPLLLGWPSSLASSPASSHSSSLLLLPAVVPMSGGCRRHPGKAYPPCLFSKEKKKTKMLRG